MKKTKLPDHVFMYDAQKGEWIDKGPGIFKDPYEKPEMFDKILEEKDFLIKSLEAQIQLLERIIQRALNEPHNT